MIYKLIISIISSGRVAEYAVQTEELAGALALSGGLGMYLFYSASVFYSSETQQKETRKQP